MIRKEDVRKKLEYNIRQCEERIEIWQNVVRNHKKNGEDFANVWKNFTGVYKGCEFTDSIELKIYGTYPNYSLGSDNTYVLTANPTADDIENAIKERIEYLKSYKAELRDNLGVMDKLYDDTMEKLTAIKDNITEIAGNRTSLWYIMMEAIEQHYYSTSPRK